MDKPRITKNQVKTLFESKFVKVFDLQYEEGRHYYDATRRSLDELVAIKPDEEFQTMIPDAVSCAVILKLPQEEPRLLLSYEYRYPAGQFLLSVPAGLIDAADRTKPNPILSAASRELKEETGLEAGINGKLAVINPFLFSTPGMTDESNALVCAIFSLPDLSMLSQAGAEGSERFDGFTLLTKKEAKQILENGRDEHGNFYSVYTWAALAYFVADLWKTYE